MLYMGPIDIASEREREKRIIRDHQNQNSPFLCNSAEEAAGLPKVVLWTGQGYLEGQGY